MGRIRKPQIVYFGNKSSSMQTSSKPVSQISSEHFRKEIDTPQFRQSLASNR